MTTKGRANMPERGEAEEAEHLRSLDPHSDTHEIAPCTRVLVVDDEPLLLKTFQRLLGREHAVTVSNTATEALERIAGGERFDVIVCDLMMPRVSGMDFYESLQNVDANLAARTVFVTGGAFTHETREFLRRVPIERIEKPWNADELRTLVRRVAGRKR
jgi:CheY-like chemotaxis protein